MSTGIRHAMRGLARAPGNSLAIVATLALGIGATVAIFSVVNGVLLQPLPFVDPNRVVMLWQRAPGVGVTEDWLSPAQYFDIEERAKSLESTAVVFGREVTLGGEGAEPERIGALAVSSSWFGVLGIEPAIGKPLAADDDVPGSPPRVLLTDGLFQRRFGGDAAVVGKTIRFDGVDAEILGVLPPELVLDADLFPTLITVPVFDLLVALPMEDPGVTTRGSENYNVIGRLAPEAGTATLEVDLLELAELFRKDPGSLAAGLEAGSGFRLDAVSLSEQVSGSARLPLMILLGATLALLAVSCANVANLLLTSASERRRELGIRAALGARPRDLLRHALLRSLLLALAGGAAGLGIASTAVSTLHRLAPAELPRLHDVAIGMPVVAFTALLSLAATLAFGVVPALRTARAHPGEAMRAGAMAVRARSAWRSGGSRALVIAQVAISLVLVAGALLLGRSFQELRAVAPGFDPAATLTYRIALAGERYADPGERVRFFQQVNESLRGLDLVAHAGGVSMLPFTRGYAWTDFRVEGREVVDARDRIVADLHIVTPDYFEALGAGLIAGRTFSSADGSAEPVVMVNRAFAERFWGAREAVGKWAGRDHVEEKATIVGVVETVRQYGLVAEARPAVYYAHAMFPTRSLYGVVRVRGNDPAAVAAAVKAAVHKLDPELPVYDVRTMPARIASSLARERLLMTLIGLFGAVALAVAAVGLYGVLAFVVASHTHEIGIRKSLGARTIDLYGLVLGGAARTVVIGAAIGLLAVVAMARTVAGILHGVSATDPMALGAALAIVSAISIAAAVVPARRATRVDPMVALRSE